MMQLQAERAAELQAARAADVEAEHALRAANRARRRRRNKARAGGVLKALLVSAFSLGLWVAIAIGLADFRWAQSELGQKRVQLAALQAQLETGQARLNALQVDKGQAQSLIEHGYVRSGDRILLFPPEPDAAHASLAAPSSAAKTLRDSHAVSAGARPNAGNRAVESQPQSVSNRASNDRQSDDRHNAAPAERTSSGESASREGAPGQSDSGTPSMWRRAGKTLNDWWRAARGQ